MRGWSSILSLFRNEFNKFNNTGAQVFDPIYHWILLKIALLAYKRKTCCHFLHKVRKRANIRNRYNQAPHLTQIPMGK